MSWKSGYAKCVFLVLVTSCWTYIDFPVLIVNESCRRVQKADKFLTWGDSPPTPHNGKLIHENLARTISTSRGKKTESFQPQLGLDPPVTIIPTIAAPELQLSESPNILKRYDTPPAEHGSARWRRRWEGLTFELGWDFLQRQSSQRGKLHLDLSLLGPVFFPLKLPKLVSIWDSNTQRAQKGKT